MSSRRDRLTGGAALALIAMLAMGCGGGGAADDACSKAFAAQVNPIGGGNGVTALDGAIQACGTVEAWNVAWAAYPGSHGSAVDPIIFLKGRCLEDALASAPLCVAVNT